MYMVEFYIWCMYVRMCMYCTSAIAVKKLLLTPAPSPGSLQKVTSIPPGCQ